MVKPMTSHVAVSVVALLVSTVYVSSAELTTHPAPDTSATRPSQEMVNDAVRLLSSLSKGEQDRGVLQLLSYVNRGYLEDLDNKAVLFERAAESNDVQFAYKVATLLAKLPRDADIVSASEDKLRGRNLSAVIAALTYLERHSPAAITEYYKNKKYADLSLEEKKIFSSNPEVVQMRDAYIASMISQYLAWRPPKGTADRPNPFREALLRESTYVALYIARNNTTFAQPQVDMKLIWLLGEIGHHSSFDMLLTEYRLRPNYRTAISLGACAGGLQMKGILETFKGRELSTLLKDVFGEETYMKIRSLKSEELLQYWKDHYVEIKKRCMELSHPQIG